MLTARRFQTVLIAGAALVTLYFTFLLLKEMFDFFPLKAAASAHISQWEVEEVKGKFALRGVYVFQVQGKNWQGSSRLLPPYYWNEPSALAALKVKAKESWTVWYNPNHPDHSALQKSFPSGLLFRTLVCYSVLIYFFVMKLFTGNLGTV